MGVVWSRVPYKQVQNQSVRLMGLLKHVKRKSETGETPLLPLRYVGLNTNRFREEPSDHLLKKVFSVAKKFPHHTLARPLVNSVIIRRLRDKSVNAMGWPEEVKVKKTPHM